jgi:hypothetical protein
VCDLCIFKHCINYQIRKQSRFEHTNKLSDLHRPPDADDDDDDDDNKWDAMGATRSTHYTDKTHYSVVSPEMPTTLVRCVLKSADLIKKG